MRLLDLEPRWIHPNVFLFKCPHCQKDLLSCKNVVMSSRDQHDLFEKALGEDWNMIVVPCKEDQAWSFSNQDFSTISVTPSFDASKSGHWHGYITNGEIR
jgi:uncharacterized protein DUF6527